jgi:uncharacterized protein (UPF0276 family)
VVVAAAEAAAAVAADTLDRVGLGWRPELALGILSHVEQIDVVEVIADDLFSAPRQQRRAMQTLARQTTLVLHGVSLGLASAEPADEMRIEKMARLVAELEPAFWSEHLAFVRAGGREVGHLAAPPRTECTVEGARRNIERATRRVGAAPLLENIATLIEPPGSTMDEASWVSSVLRETGCRVLLDLNNLHSNAHNFGFDALGFLDAIPLERVHAVHLAGGRWVRATTGEQRLLDDHLHDVPEAVYGLLTELARRAPQPLTVILERDGAYPAFEQLLGELARARRALAEGRRDPLARASVGHGRSGQAAWDNAARDNAAREAPSGGPGARHSPAALQAFLAQLYVDAAARERFLADPRREAQHRGLDGAAVDALAHIDRSGLELAAHSFDLKRRGSAPSTRRRSEPAPPSRHFGWAKRLWRGG